MAEQQDEQRHEPGYGVVLDAGRMQELPGQGPGGHAPSMCRTSPARAARNTLDVPVARTPADERLSDRGQPFYYSHLRI